MDNKYNPVRGTRDLLGIELTPYHAITDVVNKIARLHSYQKLESSVIESESTFTHSLGLTSDIVNKEMYKLQSRDEESSVSQVLRPEGTAQAIRAFASKKLFHHTPVKLFYHGPMFRYERPQRGRYRQFYQVGFENIGSSGVLADLELILIAQQFIKDLNITNYTLDINYIGNTESRAKYTEALVNFFKSKEDGLSSDSKNRLNKNPMRILDSKSPGDIKLLEEAPKIIDFLPAAEVEYFNNLKSLMDTLNIQYTINHRLVRGLDYYTGFVFEYSSNLLGAQSAFLAGGRYDGLCGEMTGQDIKCAGFAIGVDRVALMIEGSALSHKLINEVAIVCLSDHHYSLIQDLEISLYNSNISYNILSLHKGSMKKYLNLANKISAKICVIIGDNEFKDKTYNIKNMTTGDSVSLDINNAMQHIREILNVH